MSIHDREDKEAAWAQPMSTTIEFEAQCAAMYGQDDENVRES